MKRFIVVWLIVALLLPVLPASARQDSCGSAPPSSLTDSRHAQVVAGRLVPVFDAPGGTQVGSLDATIGPIILLQGPQCSGDAWWWYFSAGEFYDTWIPETAGDQYLLEPFQFVPATPAALGVPMTDPVISNPDVPLPAVNPAGSPQNLTWDWAAYTKDAWYQTEDPLTLSLPAAYAGDFPTLPVNLDTVHFVQDANLTPEQLALLSQNGFVVVPGGIAQFDELYYGENYPWPQIEGKGDFITTDAFLHSLYLLYQNTLMLLEMNEFYGRVANFVGGGYLAAQAQLTEAMGTPLETPARNAAVYYAVALLLLADGEPHYLIGYEQFPGFLPGAQIPSQVLAQADPAILALAQPVVDLARAGEGRLQVSILDNYEEDFSQYKPRGYYAGNPLLESYFRSMMWLGRITFRAKSEADTLTGLLTLRALMNGSGAYNSWTSVSDLLAFMVGPMDDYSPVEYQPLAEQVFGAGLPLAALADPAKLADFLGGVAELPAPRVNSIPLPVGIAADEVDAETRGFRLMGQRFTFDGYIMQQLIYPEVGTQIMSRALPLGLDVAAVLGSDIAYTLAEEAGATAYENYTEHVAALRDEVNSISGDAWVENLYGGWLWTLQPLLVRDPALTPPMMLTDAWKRKDIHTALGSWTELKHATLLYAEQPSGGLGGGGYEPPVTSTTIIEPNPLVFARIAIVAATLDNGLAAHGFYRATPPYTPLASLGGGLSDLALLSARMAEIARDEIAGTPISYEELYWLQEHFGSAFWSIRYIAELPIADPPDNVALIADVASNPSAGTALEEAIGLVDIIYVVANGPNGLHLTRGGVYSYYEFVQPIDQRLTDDEWRGMVAAGTTPPRPDWTSLYFAD